MPKKLEEIIKEFKKTFGENLGKIIAAIVLIVLSSLAVKASVEKRKKTNPKVEKENEEAESKGSSQDLGAVAENVKIPYGYIKINGNDEYLFEEKTYKKADGQEYAGESLCKILFPYLNTKLINQALVNTGKAEGVRTLLNDTVINQQATINNLARPDNLG